MQEGGGGESRYPEPFMALSTDGGEARSERGHESREGCINSGISSMFDGKRVSSLAVVKVGAMGVTCGVMH